MSSYVFFLNRLRPGARAEDYERFLREVDYPTAESMQSILSYRVVRVDGRLDGGRAPHDYVEVVEVADLEQYRSDLATLPGREAFLAELRSHVGEAVDMVGRLVEG